MSRAAVCLFFILILHTGIITFSQANETSTDGISKNDEEITTKPTEVEPAKDSEVPSKIEAKEKSGVSSKTELKVEEASDVLEKKDDKPIEKKETKTNEPKKEDLTEKTTAGDTIKFLPDVLKGAPVEHTKGLFEFPKNILGSVNDVGAKIGEVVSKSIDTAKDLAGGTFNFLRTSATNIFEP